jgi:hypothetical protein
MTDRPKIMLSPDREAWYDEAFRVSREYIDKATAKVIETAKAKGVGGDE